jgi:hypothetical protein
VVVAIGADYYAGHDLSSLDGAAGAAGAAVALFVVPGLVPSIWLAFRKFRYQSARGPLQTWTLLQLLMSLSHVNSVTTPAFVYTFQPQGCEFSIRFPDRPREYNVQKADASGQAWPLLGAEFVLSGEQGLLRAECVILGSLGQSQLTDEFMRAASRQIALDMGIGRMSIRVERGSCGVVATVSGTKETDRGRLFIEVTNYHGKRSIFTVYLTALSKNWEPTAMTTFSRSLQCHL